MDGTDALGGLLGVAAIATAAYVSHERRQELAAAAARHAATGWTLPELAREMTSGYDKWSDGSFDIQPWLGIRSWGEDVRTERSSRRDAVWGAQYSGAAFVTTTDSTTFTIAPLLTAADANHDGTVVLLEVENLLRRFDVDKDGRISAAERAAAYGQYGEVVDGRSSRVTDVDLPVPPDGHGRHRAPSPRVYGREPLAPGRPRHVDVGGRPFDRAGMLRMAQAALDGRAQAANEAR
ncbi:MAG: hypothetical protein JWN72_1402 [Thermoleophilia bacterium]|nr:hypothetical protein [Thermoleophilia bacterium]